MLHTTPSRPNVVVGKIVGVCWDRLVRRDATERVTAFPRVHTLMIPCSMVLSGCFGLKPPAPIVSTVSLDGVQPEAEVVVDTQQTTTIENVDKKSSTCPPGHSAGSAECVVTHYTVKEPVTRTKTTMIAGSHQLTYAQFLTLTEADRPQRVAALNDNIRQCKRARIPRFVSIGLGVVGGALLIYGATEENKPLTYSGAAVAGTALAVGGAGLILARGSCSEARSQSEDLDLSKLNDTTVRGANSAKKIQTLADEHNAR